MVYETSYVLVTTNFISLTFSPLSVPESLIYCLPNKATWTFQINMATAAFLIHHFLTLLATNSSFGLHLNKWNIFSISYI